MARDYAIKAKLQQSGAESVVSDCILFDYVVITVHIIIFTTFVGDTEM